MLRHRKNIQCCRALKVLKLILLINVFLLNVVPWIEHKYVKYRASGQLKKSYVNIYLCSLLIICGSKVLWRLYEHQISELLMVNLHMSIFYSPEMFLSIFTQELTHVLWLCSYILEWLSKLCYIHTMGY